MWYAMFDLQRSTNVVFIFLAGHFYKKYTPPTHTHTQIHTCAKIQNKSNCMHKHTASLGFPKEARVVAKTSKEVVMYMWAWPERRTRKHSHKIMTAKRERDREKERERQRKRDREKESERQRKRDREKESERQREREQGIDREAD